MMASYIFGVILVVIAFLIIGLAHSEYFYGYRNRKTMRFMFMLSDLAFAACTKRVNAGVEDWELPWKIANKLEYNTVCHSFKPFKLESWFTEDEIKILKGGEA